MMLMLSTFSTMGEGVTYLYLAPCFHISFFNIYLICLSAGLSSCSVPSGFIFHTGRAYLKDNHLQGHTCWKFQIISELTD